ncbi:hypothetical protein ACRQ1B_29240, partial [Rhizobium panacihumi]|uniref:hypothetical protein n=1 Tax=Rhizobium panacihumi TaxID=2008450 RepID=UPI003D7C0A76
NVVGGTSPYHPAASKQLRGVLRFDGHLTGAIYCSKKYGKVHPVQDISAKSGVLPIPQLP